MGLKIKEMKQIDKLKHQRYEISMKIIKLESVKKLSKKEEAELQILKKKELSLDEKITHLTSH